MDAFVTDQETNNLLYTNNGNGTFTEITTGILVNDGGTSTSGNWGDYNNDGFIDIFVTNRYEENFLYTNNGDGTFTKVTTGVVVNDSGMSSWGSSWIDYDNDNDLDLFVANAYGKNPLYANNGDGSFTKITDGDIVNDSTSSRSLSWGDYDNDGDMDLYVTNSSNQQNLFYTNNGDGSFTKILNSIIVSDAKNSRGSGWADIDNDGDLDLYVTNISGEFNSLYINNGDGSFIEDATSIIARDSAAISTIGCAWGDYDRDGFLDLFVADAEDNLLYHNDGNSNAWINIKCVGTVSNASAIGTKVKLRALINGNSTWQYRIVTAQSGYLSQSSLNVSFGLADAQVIDTIVIEWASGIVDQYTDLATNQFLTAIEGSHTSIQSGGETEIRVFELAQNYPNPFNSSTVISYRLPVAGKIKLKVYDLLGREVKSLVDEYQNAGSYKFVFDATNLASGIYLYRLESDMHTITKKMLLIE